MAGSMMSGRLVAPMMKTFFLVLMPSISVSTWLMTRSAAPPVTGERGEGRGEGKRGEGRGERGEGRGVERGEEEGRGVERGRGGEGGSRERGEGEGEGKSRGDCFSLLTYILSHISNMKVKIFPYNSVLK